MPATAPTLTSEQQTAISTRRVSVALSAGAGCGKTHVLTERYLSHLDPEQDDSDQLELHQLVAITFTDRAAREMRDRIRAKCYERLQDCPPAQVNRWIDLLRTLDTARVSTIHAFCAALLRAHAVEAELDPQFAVLEQSQADTLLAELIDDVLRERLADHEEPLLNLTEQFGLDTLRQMVSTIVNSQRAIDFDTWLARPPAEIVAIWDKYHREVILPQVLKQVPASPAARDLLAVIAHLGNVTGELGDRCRQLAQLLPGLADSKRPAADLDAITQSARVQGAGGKKLWPDETLYERFKDAATKLREEAKWTASFFEFDRAAAEADTKAGLDLLRLVHAVHERYDDRKRELALLDFNDLLVRARNLLADPAHADLQRRLAAQVRLLLVDECQDTDPVQVDLIKALCGDRHTEGKLFFVGDYKQSIYRFRGADPAVFRRLQAETPSEGRLPLTLNFRSQPAILEFVNALFCDILSPGDDSTLAYEPLQPHRPQVMPLPAVEFLWAMIEGRRPSEAGAKDEARRGDADFVARRIRGMLDRSEPLVADRQSDHSWIKRPVEKRDIAILFRTLSDVQHYEEALRRYGVEYYLVGGHAFYAQQEIYDVLNLLRALVSPADEVSLAGVLRSPMFALTDETLFWLAQNPRGLAAGLFAERLPDQLTGDDRARAEFAAVTLKYLRDRKDRLPIVGLLNEALRLTGYDAALLAEFMGQRKLANLRKLLAQARSFDASGVLGLADFIVQLSEFVVQQPREALAATHPEGTNVVRLMTIHQAKGLEFPVVFIPDLDRSSRAEDARAAWHDVLGPLVKVPDRPADALGVCGFDLYRQSFALEEDAERFRVLYVAATRAADYLVLSSGMFDLDKPSGPWTKLLAERFDLQSGDFRANLPKKFGRPVVNVSTEPPEIKASPQSAHTPRDLEDALNRALQMAQSFEGAVDALARPIAVDAAARKRFSISRLSGQLKPADELAPPATADDDQSQVAAPAEFGTLVHQVLARVNFGEAGDVPALVRRCLEARGDEAGNDARLCEALVESFLKSARAKELAGARQVHRELEFLLAWPPPGVESEPDGVAHRRYLQGYIDCLYQDAAGNWHLLDYKTNNVAAAQAARSAAQYEMQLGVYALAVEQILGQPPAELVVHFLRPSAERRFVWDPPMRRRTIEQVNQAMDAMVKIRHNS